MYQWCQSLAVSPPWSHFSNSSLWLVVVARARTSTSYCNDHLSTPQHCHGTLATHITSTFKRSPPTSLLPSSCISTCWGPFHVASLPWSFHHVSLSSSPSLTTRSRACSSDHTFFNQALPSSRISSHDCYLPWSFSYGSHPQASSQPVARVTDSFHCWYRGRMVHSKTHATVVLLLWLCSVHFVHHSRASTSCNWLQSDMLLRPPRWCFFSAVVLWPCICIIMDVALPVVAGILARSLGSTILLPWVFVFCLVKLDQLHSVTKLLVVMVALLWSYLHGFPSS